MPRRTHRPRTRQSKACAAFMHPRSTWKPNSIANLVSRYDASNPATLWQNVAKTTPAVADGDVVQVFADSVGSYDFILQSATAPVLKLAIVNGRNIVRFTGASSTVLFVNSATPWGAPSAATVMYVNKPRTTSSNGGLLKSGTNVSVCYQSFSSTDYYADFGSTTRHGPISPAGINYAVANCYAELSQSGTWQSLVNNVSALSEGNTVGWQISPEMGCGGSSGGTPGDHDVCELLIYSRILTSVELTYNYNGLKAKWGTP